MYSKTVILNNPEGLHARPASRFVACAKRWESTISLTKEEKTVNAKSMIDVLTLAAGRGAEVSLAAEGPDEQAAIDALVALLHGTQSSGDVCAETGIRTDKD
jgi:phosphocarrier protein